MRKIMLLNAKGGSGKTTIATNLASYYATKNLNVVLADFDPQKSSLSWLSARSPSKPPIRAYDGVRRRGASQKAADICIMDTPAALHGKDLNSMIRRAETIIIPVLPSMLDMRAAREFIKEIRSFPAIIGKRAKIAVIGNRVRMQTNVAWQLDEFLLKLRFSFPTHLRDSMNYIRAAEKGLGIFEMSRYATIAERDDWMPLLRWLGSQRSMPY
ncbi:MAG: ParA family protein [Chromatiales bacterium]|nr:ParA family protein [Chromatiales bacterium]